MIYIGFGFLMVFLKTGSWTAVGFNYMLSAFAFQWGILNAGFWHQVFGGHGFKKISLDIMSLILGDFAAGCCMITYGALLGKADLFQLFVLMTLEIIFYALNESIAVQIYHAVDMGGSMVIHTFGAFFGLAASYFFNNRKAIEQHDAKCGGGYVSQYVAMLGTVFLFMFWPSFNSALAPAISQQRVVVNTAMAMSASCIGAAAFARLNDSKLEMEIMLNATLAGGVIIGAASDIVVAPGVAIIIGGMGGMVSAAGFAYLTPGLRNSKFFHLHDTCGVLNLHGIPGVLGALSGAVCAALADQTWANPEAASIVFAETNNGRSFKQQGGYQLAALFTTLFIAIVGGAFSGWISSKVGRNPHHLFEDVEHFVHVHYEHNLDKHCPDDDHQDKNHHK